MHNLFECYYFPAWMIYLMAIGASFACLCKFSTADFQISSISACLNFLIQQSLAGWLIQIFILLIFLILKQTKLNISTETITLTSFGFILNQLVDYQHLEKTQLYTPYHSRHRMLKSIQNKPISQMQKWQKSRIAFLLHPNDRKAHKLQTLDLSLLSESQISILIPLLQQHWKLNPEHFLGSEHLLQQRLKYKLR